MSTNQLPTKGTENWGDILNSWLSQLGPENLGGIHNGDTASRPSGLTADDEGRVYVDTESQEILRWDGSAWQTTLSGNKESKFNIQSKTADYTITTAEAETGLNGFSNDGATGTIKFTLPDAVAGMKVTIINTEDQTLQVQSVNDDKIYTTSITSGTELLITTTKASVTELYCINGTEWISNGSSSSWIEPHIDAPTVLNVVVNNVNDIDLSWVDNSSDEIGFRIYRSTDGTNFTELSTVLADITTYKDTAASPNTDYWYRVTSYNSIIESGPTNAENISSGMGVNDPGNFSANPADYAGNIQVGWKIGGGWVFQTNGTTGLIMAPWDETLDLRWKNTRTSTTGTDSETDGAANTAAMANATHPAANACATKNINGFHDWFLPAKDQLHSLILYVIDSTADYHFSFSYYWSSSQVGPAYAWLESTAGNQLQLTNKGSAYGVRAVRSF